MKMNSAQLYINEIKRLVEAVENTQAENIERAAELIADALSTGGYVFTFGIPDYDLVEVWPCADRRICL